MGRGALLSPSPGSSRRWCRRGGGGALLFGQRQGDKTSRARSQPEARPLQGSTSWRGRAPRAGEHREGGATESASKATRPLRRLGAHPGCDAGAGEKGLQEEVAHGAPRQGWDGSALPAARGGPPGARGPWPALELRGRCRSVGALAAKRPGQGNDYYRGLQRRREGAR